MGRSSKDKRDIYYRLAKEQGWRARSAFKLLQIDEEHNILSDISKVVDLCAAPGSWSQVLSKTLPASSKIVAIDLQKIAPLNNVICIQGDITEKKTAQEIITKCEGKAELVICDGAPDVTGLHDIDEYIQQQLILAAFSITCKILLPGGTFLAKIFRGKNMSLLVAQMNLFFDDVMICKPRASRDSSIEAFILCKNYQPPKDYNPDDVLLDLEDNDENRAIARFMACGDLDSLDADKTYRLEDNYQSLPPVISPIDPPYKQFLERKQNN